MTLVLRMSNVQESVATDEGFHDESTHDTEPLVRDYRNLYLLTSLLGGQESKESAVQKHGSGVWE